MNTPYLDELRAHVTALKALLDDPHPGLYTWIHAYVQRMQAIADLWSPSVPPERHDHPRDTTEDES